MNRSAATLAGAIALVLASTGCGGDGAATPGDPCALSTAGAPWVAFSSSRTGATALHLVRSDGTCERQVGTGEGGELYATGSPAGTVAFMSRRNGRMQVHVQDLAAGSVRLLDTGAVEATQPAFSPDGSRIALEAYSPGVTEVSDVLVLPAGGGPALNLTGGGSRNGGPAWSPDGTQVYFVSDRSGRWEVWRVAVAGGAATQVTSSSGILGRPAVSPDGASIAYTRPAAGSAFAEVAILELATGAVRVLSGHLDAEPAYDATGTRMVVTSQRSGNPDILLLDVATGSALRALTSDLAIDGGACFLPMP